jgi:hypothetical protein
MLDAELGRGYRQNHGRWVELDGFVGYRSDIRNPTLHYATSEAMQAAVMGAAMEGVSLLTALGLAAAAGLGVYFAMRKA